MSEAVSTNELRRLEVYIDHLQSELAKERERRESAEKQLRLITVRLDICLGRITACNDDTRAHQVSVEEIPAWIEEAQEHFKKYEDGK